VEKYSKATGWKEFFKSMSFSFANQTGTAVLEGTVTGVAATDSIPVYLYIHNPLKSGGMEDYLLVATVFIGADGQYSFDDLPGGDYKVVVGMSDEYTSFASEPVHITGGAAGNVDFEVDIVNKTVFPVNSSGIGVTGDVETLSATSLQIYPNPFTDVVRITGAAVGEGLAPSQKGQGQALPLQVINTAGAIVHTQKIASPDESIHLGHLPAGMYFFRFEKDGKTETVKAVKIQ
jgi:hypothetical protein